MSALYMYMNIPHERVFSLKAPLYNKASTSLSQECSFSVINFCMLYISPECPPNISCGDVYFIGEISNSAFDEGR